MNLIASRDSTAWEQRRLDAETWRPSSKSVVVVSPHPDDEVLIAGGLIHNVLLDERVGAVVVLAVTNGEAAYRNVTPDALSELRKREQVAALKYLGADKRVTITRMGLPDSQVHRVQDLVGAELAHHVDPDWLIVAPWRHDHHSDHEACGRAAYSVAANSGCELVEGLFWAWQHPVPSDTPSLRYLSLSDDATQLKREALAAHRSQLVPDWSEDPVLTDSDLAPLRWRREFYFVHEAGSL